MPNLATGGRGLARIPYRVDRRTTVGLALQRTPGAYFSGGNFWNADFRASTLRGGLLKNATLRGTDFSGADLRNAVLDSASFIRTSLVSAELQATNLFNADLRNVFMDLTNFSDADLHGTPFDGGTMDQRHDLRNRVHRRVQGIKSDGDLYNDSAG